MKQLKIKVMQGPESDKRDVKISFILMLFVFLALILAGVSCTQWDKEEKQNRERYNALFKYQEGDVVYIKPDSSLASITDREHFTSGDDYHILYRGKNGSLETGWIREGQIYGKK